MHVHSACCMLRRAYISTQHESLKREEAITMHASQHVSWWFRFRITFSCVLCQQLHNSVLTALHLFQSNDKQQLFHYVLLRSVSTLQQFSVNGDFVVTFPYVPEQPSHDLR